MTRLITLSNGGDVLTCPSCDGDYLHHEGVTAFERFDGQDDGDGLAISVIGTQVGIVHKEDTGIPGRRNSVMMRFHCEQCPHHSWLTIEQHKGQTFIYWSDIET